MGEWETGNPICASKHASMHDASMDGGWADDDCLSTGNGFVSQGAYALRATVDEIAEAAKDPTTRQELVDLLILPCNGPALLTLEALVGAEEDTLSRSGIRAICTILWPASPSNLPLASVLLTLNRVMPLATDLVPTILPLLSLLHVCCRPSAETKHAILRRY